VSMFGTERDVDAIAEYADASVRVMSRRGSLAPVSGRHGFNEWLYDRLGQPRQRDLHLHGRPPYDRHQRRARMGAR